MGAGDRNLCERDVAHKSRLGMGLTRPPAKRVMVFTVCDSFLTVNRSVH
jgi:hypothetical protein